MYKWQNIKARKLPELSMIIIVQILTGYKFLILQLGMLTLSTLAANYNFIMMITVPTYTWTNVF